MLQPLVEQDLPHTLLQRNVERAILGDRKPEPAINIAECEASRSAARRGQGSAPRRFGQGAQRGVEGASKSPVMYNAVYEKAGLPWHYGLMDVPTAPETEAFLAARDFLSINITTPYKPEAFAAADVRAASATLAHGANVLVNKDGALIAYTTDGQGCVAYLERAGVDFRGTSVVGCGTGPTSLSILHAVAQAGPDEVILIGRDKAKARNR